MAHISVLLGEAIDGLKVKAGDVFLDGTVGSGGHSAKVCSSHKNIRLIGFDLDPEAIVRAREKVASAGCDITLYNDNFRNAKNVLGKTNSVNAILLDLGTSSPQIDDSGRGFSFMRDEPLYMTLGAPSEGTLTAEEVVNTWAEESLADIIYGYGEERFARKVAKAIVDAREIAPIKTTLQLADIVKSAIPARFRSHRINPATKTFQAIRIAVNDELGSLKDGLAGAIELLAPEGRIAVISFHSLEDRIVKRFFDGLEKSDVGVRITKKPIVPTQKEILSNPRSRSAKLRIFQKA